MSTKGHLNSAARLSSAVSQPLEENIFLY